MKLYVGNENNSTVIYNDLFLGLQISKITLHNTVIRTPIKETVFSKHCGEKKKMLVTSIFFFSTQCFLSSQRQIPLFKPLNPFPNNKFLDPSKLKAFPDDNFKFDENGRQLSSSVETLRKKEKLLVMSNFFFSLSVLKGLVQQTRKNQGLFGKGLIICCLQKLSA